MQKTKIVEFLKCLSKNELKDFGKFVSSPFHNTRKELIQFYEVLKKYFPLNDNNPVDKEKIFNELFPGKKYNPAVIDRLNSNLFILTREFLTIISLRQEPFFFEYLLLMEMNYHKTDYFFEKELQYARNSLNKNKFHYLMFFGKYHLEFVRSVFYLQRNKQEVICGNVLKSGEYRVFDFITAMANCYQGLHSNKSKFNFDFQNSVPELFIKHIDFEGFMNDYKQINSEYFNYVSYYYYCIMCYKYPENENYYKFLKKFAYLDFEKLEDGEKQRRYDILNGYCITRINKGNPKFVKESFDNQKDFLENKFTDYIKNEKHKFFTFFRNFVYSGLTCKEYDYIEKFISDYRMKLPDRLREDTLNIANSQLYFEKKQYTKAIECLSLIQFTHPHFKIDVKMLYIKIYYELNDEGALETFIDAFRHFCSRNKFIENNQKTDYLNFLNYIGRLAKIRSTENKDSLLEIKNEINNKIINYSEKKWLMEKVEELWKK